MTRSVSKHERITVTLTVNGKPESGHATARTLLSDFLRHELMLTGTHVGCEHGVCGACTIEVDGNVARSCLMLAVQADGCTISTVETDSDDDHILASLREAFMAHHGLQCGFCTPGILMSLRDLLSTEPSANDARIREVLGGHLCRCTGYAPIVAAASAARDNLLQQSPQS